MWLPESRGAQDTSFLSAVACLKLNQEALCCCKEFYLMSLMLLNLHICLYKMKDTTMTTSGHGLVQLKQHVCVYLLQSIRDI